ncbi:MAG: DUF1080 domain-containing protein [Bacteroidales bacterium]|nr:DUF1080 domain-containing protein [Bacteroidales bacterium]MCF8391648.1 DUF1080 domain-containing protein [Bacteroidales bacterium]
MKTNLVSLVFLASLILLSGCNNKSNKPAILNAEEDGWISLFNGIDLSGWRSFHSDTIEGWTVEDSCLTALGKGGDLGGDIISTDKFENFILELEWKIEPEGNSGIMFHVLEDGYKTTYETGPEYQLIDDKGFPEPLEDWQTTAANYAMHKASDNKQINPVGEFNKTKIVVDSSHVEHWINGVKVVEYELWSEEWLKLKESGKWKDYPDYGMAKSGYISLQDHGSKTWFRNIRLKKL